MIPVQRRQLVVAGYLFAFGAAVFYGTSTFLGRKLVMEFAPPLVLAAFSLMFGALFLAILFHREIPATLAAPRRALWFMVLAGVAASIGVTILFFALSVGTVVTVAPIVSLQPLVAIALTHLFLQRLEKVTLRILLGTMLVVMGVTLVVVSNAG